MVAELRRRLHAGEGTLVAPGLYGAGGVGKTQLALEYAHRFAADYDLVWWVHAEQSVFIPEELAALATQLDLPAENTVAKTVERLLVALRGRDRWLLVLDNAERPQDVTAHLPGGTGHVAGDLPLSRLGRAGCGWRPACSPGPRRSRCCAPAPRA